MGVRLRGSMRRGRAVGGHHGSSALRAAVPLLSVLRSVRVREKEGERRGKRKGRKKRKKRKNMKFFLDLKFSKK
jgi:hypothetical protein